MRRKSVQTSIFISPGFHFEYLVLQDGKQIQSGIDILTKRICYYPLLLLNRYFLTSDYYSPISNARLFDGFCSLRPGADPGDRIKGMHPYALSTHGLIKNVQTKCIITYLGKQSELGSKNLNQICLKNVRKALK